MSDQTDQFEEFRQFIRSADKQALLHQLNTDVKTPLVSAQNILNMLVMMQSPSPAIQKKIASGELNSTEMLTQITELITQVFDVIDFYRNSLSGE
jgi:hypothetical protein